MTKQDLFSKYLGKLEVEIDGEKLELDVRLKDKHKIMSLMSKATETMSEETLEALTNIYKTILKRSFPEETEVSLDAFLLRKFESLMTALSVAFGWTTKEELEKRIKERLAGIPEKKGI